jgi:hypothetical protein
MKLSLYEQLHHDRATARRARWKPEQTQGELTRLRHELAAIRVSLPLIKLKRILEGKYRPDQPRVPAGQPGGSLQTAAAGAIAPPIRPRELVDSQKSSVSAF